MVRPVFAVSFAVLGLASVSCGGSSAPAEAPPATESAPTDSASAPAEEAAAAEPEATGPAAIPLTCHKESSVCTPNPKWVKRLCADVYPAVALYLNQPSSPFSRGYLTRKTKAVNASGGATSGNEYLAFDEQVVLLYHRSANLGGMTVSGASGGYDALRWDGSCVTLDGSEVTMSEPPKALRAPIDWRYLGEDVQDALKAVPAVREAFVARKQECKGAYSGDVSKKCVDKDTALQTAIIKAITSGEAKLPEPVGRP